MIENASPFRGPRRDAGLLRCPTIVPQCRWFVRRCRAKRRRSFITARQLLMGFLFAVLYASPAKGQDDLVVRTSLEPEKTVNVGQRVLLRIDVLAKDLWANLPVSPKAEIPGAVVYTPSSQSVRLNETIRGASYIGQRYELWFYPLRQGTLQVPSLDLDVQLKSFTFGEEPKTASEKTEAISIEVTYPEGADASEDLLCMEDFSAKQQWKPESREFKVGDGITRTISRSVQGAPGMLLSPIDQHDIQDVRVYWKQPNVDDKLDRGSLTGLRTESVTYVFQSEGEVNLPEIQFAWWDVKSKKRQTSVLEGLQLQIAAAPLTEADAATETAVTKTIDVWMLAWVIGTISILAAAFGYLRKPITRWLSDRRAQYKASEAAHFQRFTAATKSGQTKPTLRKLMQWWDSANSDSIAPRLDHFVNQFGDPTLMHQLTELETSVDANQTSWVPNDFAARVGMARKQWLASRQKRQTSEKGVLPPLYG